MHGTVALTMALFAVARGWQEQMVRLFGAVTLLALLFAMGENTIFEGLIYALMPGVEKARSPHMALFIYGFGLSVLCGYGIDLFRRRSWTPTSVWTQAASLFSIGTWHPGYHLLVDIFSGKDRARMELCHPSISEH